NAASCSALVPGSFFFFQAEDGIRDYKVTGVQTCALPISIGARATAIGDYHSPAMSTVGDVPAHRTGAPLDALIVGAGPAGLATRSEERRVGKEGRSRWWA